MSHSHAPDDHDRGPDEAGHLITWPRRYDLLAGILQLGRGRRTRAFIVGLLEVAAGSRVLDVGAGTGTLALTLADRVGAAGSVVAVDPAEEMVRFARAKAARRGTSVTFDVGAAQALPYPDSTFDAAVTTLVLHHVPAELRATAVTELLRVVRPGGVVVVGDFQVPPDRLTRVFAQRMFSHGLDHDDLGAAERTAVEAGAVEVSRHTAPISYLGLLRFRRPA